MKPVYSSLNITPGAARSGIIQIQVVPREWLTADPVIDFNTRKVITPVTLAAGRQWITLEFAPPTYEYNEKSKTNKPGSFYDITVSGTLNDYDATIQQVIESLRYHQLVAIVMDVKKRVRLVGTKEAALQLIVNSSVKSNSEATELTMMMESEDPAPFYTP